MIQASVSEEALRALTEFKAYAAGTLLALDLAGTFVFAHLLQALPQRLGGVQGAAGLGQQLGVGQVVLQAGVVEGGQ